MRAEDLHQLDQHFDVILSLWNVLGHIFPQGGRIEVLRQFARLLTPHGNAFVDVSHRYNARRYGVLPTALRFLRDQLSWSEKNGDVVVTWNINGESCATMGHVFTDWEVQSMCREAGLRIEKRLVIDYATGKQRRWLFEGHLLYMLARNCEQTSLT